MKKSTKTIAIIISITFLVGLGFVFYKAYNSYQTMQSIFNGNPPGRASIVAGIPDVNLYDDVQVNPFDQAKTNPFIDGYSNPFD
jgi:uncharacterized membrane protein YebE (DUF533 family)